MPTGSDPQPLVFVLILNWNGMEDTLECLRSLSAIDYSNARVVVIDNASTDGSVLAIRAQFPTVQVIENGSNLQFAGGNNVGIRYAIREGADAILLLNNDTTVDTHFLSELVSAYANDRSVGMVAPKILYYAQPDRIWYAGGVIEWWKGWISHRGIREIDRGQYDAPAPVDYITGCCLLVRRSAVETIGVLDERFAMYGEDVDWCLRARRAGFSVRYVPTARVWHKVSVSSGGHFSWFKNWNKLKGLVRLMSRYANPVQWVSALASFPVLAIVAYVRSRRWD
ncbi:MAG: glycosyltransferase family 2 protein [Ignavibacteria bacterium]|nr:glycosyltransferase family 2 protein [Ignavibacteria bacterium]